MRWKIETEKERNERFQRGKKEWHCWFAWRPVIDNTNGFIMWLEFVMYKSKDEDGIGPWLYRPITILESDLRPGGQKSSIP